jgi:hypothetical protein
MMAGFFIVKSAVASLKKWGNGKKGKRLAAKAKVDGWRLVFWRG